MPSPRRGGLVGRADDGGGPREVAFSRGAAAPVRLPRNASPTVLDWEGVENMSHRLRISMPLPRVLSVDSAINGAFSSEG